MSIASHRLIGNIFLKNFIFSCVYFFGTFIVLKLVIDALSCKVCFTETNLLNWDGAHYEDIVNHGYKGFLVAFFPLFPFLWKALHVTTSGIVLFNAILFVISASIIATVRKLTSKELLLLLSFPSLIFMFLPYSESLFFFSGTLIIWGMSNNKEKAIFMGMLIASLTRPVVYIFIPATLVLFYLGPTNGSWLKKTVIYIIPVILGLIMVLGIQYINTGDFFSFFHAQELWGNGIRFPKFHLTSWGGNETTRLDGSALLMGLAASVALVVVFLKKLKAKKQDFNNALLFSLLYIAAICWFVLFTRGGSLFSLNRFVYATPFFFIGFIALLRREWSVKQLVVIFFSINAFWLVMGSYVHIQEVLKYLLLTSFLMCFLLISNPKKYISLAAYSVCLTGNVVLQIYCYYYFLNGGWIG